MSARPAVAILRADHIGDLVLTTTLMQALAESGWSVDVIGQPAVELLKNCEFVRDVETLRAICPEWPRDWKRLAAWLQSRDYDATIVPYGRPAQLLWASAASGARHRIAMGTTLRSQILARVAGHRFYPTNFVRNPRPYHEILVDCISPLVEHPSVFPPRIVLTAEERRVAAVLLASRLDGGRRIGIHPTCFGNTCNLPLTAYRELLELILTETRWTVVVTGTNQDRATLGEWKALAAQHPRRVWISAGELGLRELAATLSALDVLVATGTGPMHLAQAVGTKTVSPFCPQAPICAEVWGYLPYEKTAVLPADPPCDPNRPHRKNCDFRGTITAGDLFDRLQKVMRPDSTMP